MTRILIVTEDDEVTAAECRRCPVRIYGPDVIADARRHVAQTGHVMDVTRHEVIRHADQEDIDRLRAASLAAAARPAPPRPDGMTMDDLIASRLSKTGRSRRSAWIRSLGVSSS